jgi:replication initiator protein
MKKLSPNQEKLVDSALTIRNLSIVERDELGFSTRIFVQCSLPHRDPGPDQTLWTRTNGNLCFSIQPKIYMKEGQQICIGYPYGNIPRIILMYICTQAIKLKSPEISLGRSLSSFMRGMGLEVTGGRGGTIGRFKEQFRRLFTAHMDFTWDYGDEFRDTKAQLARTIHLWWDAKHPELTTLFDSYVILTDDFFNEIMSYPVPVDMGIVSAIKQSPLALDLYTWLTYRVISINKPIRVSWKSLSFQLGSDYTNEKDLKRKAKEALRKIYSLWPDLQVDEVEGGILLKPSKPSVPTKLITTDYI